MHHSLVFAYVRARKCKGAKLTPNCPTPHRRCLICGLSKTPPSTHCYECGQILDESGLAPDSNKSIIDIASALWKVPLQGRHPLCSSSFTPPKCPGYNICVTCVEPYHSSHCFLCGAEVIDLSGVHAEPRVVIKTSADYPSIIAPPKPSVLTPKPAEITKLPPSPSDMLPLFCPRCFVQITRRNLTIDGLRHWPCGTPVTKDYLRLAALKAKLMGDMLK